MVMVASHIELHDLDVGKYRDAEMCYSNHLQLDYGLSTQYLGG
jgi:hypothetical protein